MTVAKVVDASVLAAWCFREERAGEAFDLIREGELHAPVLLEYELSNVARRKAVNYPEQTDLIREGLQIALGLPFTWHNVDHLEVWRSALANGLSTYDASYLLLARKLGASLLTFDQRLARISAAPQ